MFCWIVEVAWTKKISSFAYKKKNLNTDIFFSFSKNGEFIFEKKILLELLWFYLTFFPFLFQNLESITAGRKTEIIGTAKVRHINFFTFAQNPKICLARMPSNIREISKTWIFLFFKNAIQSTTQKHIRRHCLCSDIIFQTNRYLPATVKKIWFFQKNTEKVRQPNGDKLFFVLFFLIDISFPSMSIRVF